jgi:hypothetical protein
MTYFPITINRIPRTEERLRPHLEARTVLPQSGVDFFTRSKAAVHASAARAGGWLVRNCAARAD